MSWLYKSVVLWLSSWAHLIYFSLITCFNIHLRPHASEPQRQIHHHDQLETSPLASSSLTYLPISHHPSLFLYKSLNILTSLRFGTASIFVSAILLFYAAISAPAIHTNALFKVNLQQDSPLQNASIVFGSFGYSFQDLPVNGYVSVYIPL